MDSAARPYRRADLPALIEFAAAACRSPLPSYYHPGDVVWQLYDFAQSDDVCIWRRNGEVVAFAIFEPPLTFQFLIAPCFEGELALGEAALRWAEARRRAHGPPEEVPRAYSHLGDATLSTWAMEDDERRIDVLTRSGYVAGAPGGIRFARALDTPPPQPALPDGARFVAISEGDAEARAELHRDAWSVWGASGFTTERYLRLRRAPLYDPGLDIVLEIGGQLASYCLCWLDERNKVGYFEPVGTRPSAAGRGYGRAVIREGMRRLRAKGMRVATVGTASVNAAAQALYTSAGFIEAGRERFYTKRLA